VLVEVLLVGLAAMLAATVAGVTGFGGAVLLLPVPVRARRRPAVLNNAERGSRAPVSRASGCRISDAVVAGAEAAA